MTKLSRSFICACACFLILAAPLARAQELLGGGGPPTEGPVQGLVETTWDDPTWILAISDYMLRADDCFAECLRDPNGRIPDPNNDYAPEVYRKTYAAPCYPGTRWFGFPQDVAHAELFPMGSFGVFTLDSLHVRAGVPLQLYSGADVAAPFGPSMTGPQYVTLDFWIDQPLVCEGVEPGTFLVAGVYPGDLAGYSIALGPDLPAPYVQADCRPPEADDRTFVTESGTGMDAVAYRNSGPIVIPIEVDRYLGPTNPDGTLSNVAALLANNHISPHATLTIMTWDVDSDADLPGIAPEMDRVSFNGELVSALDPGNAQFLEGTNNQWRLNTFRIPIEKLKFPASPGSAGQAPTPATNTIQIEIDVAPEDERWSMAVDWAALQFDAMSPVVLLHGIGSLGVFFDLTDFSDQLTSNALVWDSGIVLPPFFVRENSEIIDTELQRIAAKFGVDSLHLVAHSKGGLDARDYLARYQQAHNSTFRVLSLTTLSTPHDGSVLADLVVQRERAVEQGRDVKFAGFPNFKNLLDQLIAQFNPLTRPGYIDLQTTTAAEFNDKNIPRLPLDITYNAIGADADTNDNGMIDNDPDEYFEARLTNPKLAGVYFLSQEDARGLVNLYYQILKDVAAVRVSYASAPDRSKIAFITAVATGSAVSNDTAVTIPSALGTDGFGTVVTNQDTLTGANGRNHSSVADDLVAVNVIQWLRQIEEQNQHGDFRPR